MMKTENSGDYYYHDVLSSLILVKNTIVSILHISIMMLPLLIFIILYAKVDSFHLNPINLLRQPTTTTTTATLQLAKKRSSETNSGKGFGKTSKSTIKVRQTYGSKQLPKDVLIDTEGAMKEFFLSKEEWHPLFASIASSDNVPALDFMKQSYGHEVTFEDTLSPWQQLPSVPTGENKDELMAVIAKVLDSSQQALVDIPVNEASKDDGDDLHFIEEGRRILCLDRFQVLENEEFMSFDSHIERHDVMFQTCWSEIMYLMKENVPDSGSLIILPDVYDLTDLKQFADMNIMRPLQWLGIDSNVMEVAALQRNSPCIRLLHKLSDIPSLEARDQKLKEEE